MISEPGHLIWGNTKSRWIIEQQRGLEEHNMERGDDDTTMVTKKHGNSTLQPMPQGFFFKKECLRYMNFLKKHDIRVP